MKRSTRPCWWCGKPLVEGSHAKATDHDGNIVQVHHQCAQSMPRTVTASPTGTDLGHGTFLHTEGDTDD